MNNTQIQVQNQNQQNQQKKFKEVFIAGLVMGLLAAGLGVVLHLLLQESVQLFIMALSMIVFILGWGIFFVELSQTREQT